MTAARAIAATAALLLGAGCGPQVRFVEGSLGELLDLRYTEVELLDGGDEFVVRYLVPQGEGENVVLEVSADILGLADFAPGVEVRLEEPSPRGGQRGHVSRNVIDEEVRAFPWIERGDFTLYAWPESGRTVRGTFSVTFQNGTNFASGRTVFDDFQVLIP